MNLYCLILQSEGLFQLLFILLIIHATASLKLVVSRNFDLHALTKSRRERYAVEILAVRTLVDGDNVKEENKDQEHADRGD